jgi:hypothetical protein
MMPKMAKMICLILILRRGVCLGRFFVAMYLTPDIAAGTRAAAGSLVLNLFQMGLDDFRQAGRNARYGHQLCFSRGPDLVERTKMG